MNGSIFSGNLFPYLKDNSLKLLTITLTMCGLALLPWQKDLAKQFIYALELLALFYFFRNIKTLPPVSRMEKIFFIVIVANFLWIAFTFYINGSPENGSNLVWSRQFFMLMLIPVYYLFREVRVPLHAIWGALIIAILVNFSISLSDIDPNITSSYPRRAHGDMHPILFGYQNFIMATFLIFTAFTKGNLYIRIASFLAASLGFLIVIWTQSRGVWAALPLIPVVIVFYTTRHWPNWKRLVLMLTSIFIIASSYLNPTVEDRINQTVNNVQRYLNSTDHLDTNRLTSIGARFEMWKAGWQIFLDNPFTGVGLGGYDKSSDAITEQQPINQAINKFKHPHSQYITALATRGLPGFIFLAGLIFIPLAMGHKWSSAENKHDEIHTYILITVSLAFAVFSLSDVPFEDKQAILLYTILIAYALASLSSERQTKSDNTGDNI